MDPDSLYWSISGISAVLSCLLIYCIGVSAAYEEDDDVSAQYGFTNRLLGLCACFLFVCGFFVYGTLQLLPSPWWLLGIAVVLCAVWALVLMLGRIQGGKKANTSKAVLSSTIGFVITFVAKQVLRLANLTVQDTVSEEDVLSMVDDVEEQDLIDENQKEMITNIFELDDVVAGDIMTHRTEIACVPASMPANEAIKLCLENGYSRMPVYGKSVDDILGILSVKDLFVVVATPKLAQSAVKNFMRPVMFVPESCRARELLVEFKKKRTQIAVVVDEYGGTGGLVTMEDVLEEIVGNIQDEFDDEEDELVRRADGQLEVAGNIDLEDVFAAFDIELSDDFDSEDFDSVNGMMISKLGRIPDQDESPTVVYEGLLFSVLQVGERRIDRVLVGIAPTDNDQTQKEEHS